MDSNKKDINCVHIKPDEIQNIEIRLELPKNQSKVNKWIDENNFENNFDDDISSIPEVSDCDSTVSISNINSLSEGFSEIELNAIDDDSILNKSNTNSQKSSSNTNPTDLTNINGLKETITKIANTSSSLKNIGNVNVENSRDIHIGNITYITGPIHVTNTGGGNIGVINQSSNNISKTAEKQKSIQINCGKTDAEFHEENVPREDSFLGCDVKCVILPNTLRMVPRRAWLAQKPMNPHEFIDGPVPYVIISHTATENPTTQPENVQIIRYIQVFHVESQKWDDIGYNFLIGGDGQAYEGRGWRVVGAHAKGYNKVSVGISFVGCYMKELPTENSINTCKLLIQSGVEQGYIAKDYKLLGHCQCSPTESPGRMLFEEIKTWPHFSRNP